MAYDNFFYDPSNKTSADQIWFDESRRKQSIRPTPPPIVTIDMPVALLVTPVKFANYTATIGQMVRCDPTAGGFNIVLPTAAGNSGNLVSIKNVSPSTNSLTVVPQAGETIDGSSTYVMDLGYESITLMSTGVVWIVV